MIGENLKCPLCGFDSNKPYKEWKYGVFDVVGYYCEGCNKRFRAYYNDGRFSHMIPTVIGETMRRITIYLKKT
jgi:hypothetical protein